jgi:hypothetical protein
VKRALFLTSLSLLAAACSGFADEPAYRTDATAANDQRPWFQLKAGEFPPNDAAHYIGGELIGLDHINRTASIRLDRTDAIRRAEWDQAQEFTLLPYALVRYHGAPAELRDLPIGTHLHGWFYAKENPPKDDKGAWTKCVRLEDDFSRAQREGRTWKVQSIDAEKSTLNVQPSDAAAGAKLVAFQLTPATRIWRGKSIGAAGDLTAGENVVVNLTVCTLKGPGRLTDVWIDEESRALASAQQLELHRLFVHEHGAGAWIDEVDNKALTVTATVFANYDGAILDEMKESIVAAVAEENLRTYDQGSDRTRGDVVEFQRAEGAVLGSSVVRIKFKPALFLEGFRPKRFIRLFSGKWKVDEIPKEERLYQ